jgi:hypothetical protein
MLQLTISFPLHFFFLCLVIFLTQVFSSLFSIKMLLPWCSCLYFALLLCSFQLGFANENFLKYGKGSNPHRKTLPYRTLLIDKSGHGNFSSIQSAIDSIPSDNKNWVCIHVRAGTYR